MKTFTASLLCACMTLAAGGVAAQDAKKAPMKDGATKPMTMTECNDYMAMAKKDVTKKDAKKDTMCTEMMKADKPKK